MRAAALSALSLALCASTAAAQVPSADLRGFDPPGAPDGGLHYEPASSPDTFDMNGALWLSYANRPVRLLDPTTGDTGFTPLKHRLAGNAVFGLGLFERALIGVDLPFALYQTGDEPNAAATRTLGTFSLPSTAIGDVKILGKVTLIPPTSDEFGGFAMAIHERFGLPTGEERSYLGEGHVTSETRLLLEYRYLALAVHADVGFEVRAEHERFGCQGFEPLPPGIEDPCRSTFGHQIPWGIGLAFRPKSIGLDDTGRSSWFVEAFGYLPAYPEAPFSNSALSQAQIAAGARTGLPADLYLLTAVDAALAGGVGNPVVRGHLALGWAPRSHDMDGDGVLDEVDLCPEDLKEDLDGFEDEDGCPEWDNDSDGVPDDSDQCEGEVEDEDGVEDDDGCVDPDNDGDGILDVDDACRDTPGEASDDPKQRGCPDPDGDGVLGEVDRCPDEPGEEGGPEPGCPNPDDDGDGILDEVDRCPDEAGVDLDGDAHDGCPDGDGDGIADREDACPAEAPEPEKADPERPGCPAPDEE